MKYLKYEIVYVFVFAMFNIKNSLAYSKMFKEPKLNSNEVNSKTGETKPTSMEKNVIYAKKVVKNRPSSAFAFSATSPTHGTQQKYLPTKIETKETKTSKIYYDPFKVAGTCVSSFVMALSTFNNFCQTNTANNTPTLITPGSSSTNQVTSPPTQVPFPTTQGPTLIANNSTNLGITLSNPNLPTRNGNTQDTKSTSF